MRIEEAEARLHQMLRDEGIDPSRPSLRETWAVFRAFVTEPVESTSDGILVQGGTYSFYGPARYVFDFVRQFEVVHDDGEHDHYEQLHCEFQFDPTPELRSLGSFDSWWFADDGTALDQFLDEMQLRPEFGAVADGSPVSAKVEQEEV